MCLNLDGQADTMCNCPDFDIPSPTSTNECRQFRFSNETTTDDHGLHLVGYLEKDGKDWYLVKDSGSGSRNNDPKAGEFVTIFSHQIYKTEDDGLHGT